MPSEPMNIQEQGFRSSLFGFDKNDVLAYMNALANEAQQHELVQPPAAAAAVQAGRAAQRAEHRRQPHGGPEGRAGCRDPAC